MNYPRSEPWFACTFAPSSITIFLQVYQSIVMENFKEWASKTGKAAGRKRQQILSHILTPSTEAFIREANLRSGMNGLDLGCGTGETTLLLKTMVVDGKITGLDSRETQLKIAKEKAHQNNVSPVIFRHQNILEWKENQIYDFIYSRLFFNQLRKPLNLLEQIYSSLKPGGLAMIEDLDFSKFQCFPSSFAFDRFIELYIEVIKRQGADPNIGKQLYSLFQKAGFNNSRVQLVRSIFLTGKYKYLASLTLENISSILINEKLATKPEIQALLFELKDFESQKNTMITLPGIYQVIGYRPE